MTFYGSNTRLQDLDDEIEKKYQEIEMNDKKNPVFVGQYQREIFAHLKLKEVIVISFYLLLINLFILETNDYQ